MPERALLSILVWQLKLWTDKGGNEHANDDALVWASRR